MTSPTIVNRLALMAFVFGALVYGPANALFGHHEHHAHHHQGAAPTDHAAEAPWDVPAHCLFCLDGIAPQPTELIAAIADKRPGHCIDTPAKSTPRRGYLRSVRPPARGPPSELELIADS